MQENPVQQLLLLRRQILVPEQVVPLPLYPGFGHFPFIVGDRLQLIKDILYRHVLVNGNSPGHRLLGLLDPGLGLITRQPLFRQYLVLCRFLGELVVTLDGLLVQPLHIFRQKLHKPLLKRLVFFGGQLHLPLLFVLILPNGVFHDPGQAPHLRLIPPALENGKEPVKPAFFRLLLSGNRFDRVRRRFPAPG